MKIIQIVQLAIAERRMESFNKLKKILFVVVLLMMNSRYQ